MDGPQRADPGEVGQGACLRKEKHLQNAIHTRKETHLQNAIHLRKETHLQNAIHLRKETHLQWVMHQISLTGGICSRIPGASSLQMIPPVGLGYSLRVWMTRVGVTI